MSSIQERSTGLSAVISTLKQAAERYRELHMEAKRVLAAHNMEGYKAEIRKAMKILDDLPADVFPCLEGVSSAVGVRIARDVQFYAAKSDELLERGNYFAMGQFLWPLTKSMQEKNDLEELIASLERRVV